MEQKLLSPNYMGPVALNIFLVLNLVWAIASAKAPQQDHYMGGLGYMLYAVLSIFISAVLSLAGFLKAQTKGNASNKVIYGVAALVFLVVSAMLMYSIKQMPNPKIG